MLQDPAIRADGFQQRRKAAVIIAFHLALSGALDPQRLPSPELAPALAGGMAHHRVRAGVLAGVAFDTPRVNARLIEVAAIRFDEQRGNHPGLTEAIPSHVDRDNVIRVSG